MSLSQQTELQQATTIYTHTQTCHAEKKSFH